MKYLTKIVTRMKNETKVAIAVSTFQFTVTTFKTS